MQITVELLRENYACGCSIRFLADLLPVTLHQDVERNLETARKVITYYKETRCSCEHCASIRSVIIDISWLLRVIRFRAYGDTSQGQGFDNIYREIDGEKLGTITELQVAKAMSWLFEAGVVISNKAA